MSRLKVLTWSSGVGIALALLAVAGPAARAADTVPWTVTEASGAEQQQGAGSSWTALAAGSALAPGAQVRTGPDGRLRLTHGKDSVTVSPGSQFGIPAGVDPATGPSLVQRLGTLLFRIEHRPERHFEVDAPYLAAVVKGTVFTVNAGALENQVHVAEGAVQVTASAAHRTALVRPGQTAVATSSGKSLTILGRPKPGKAVRQRSDADDPSKSETRTVDAASTRQGEGPRITRTLGDAPLDTAALSDGLVSAPGAGAAAAAESASDRRALGTGTADIAQTANAAGGDALAAQVSSIAAAADGNSDAGGGNPNAKGGNPNANGGNPNAKGGNPNAKGGNPNAGGSRH